MYVPVKGGERAINASHRLLAQQRRGNPQLADISLPQIDQQLRLCVDRVMTEGGLYDRGLAALAIKQAQGDTAEAIFLLRAFRATLQHMGSARPLALEHMTLSRRISSALKDLPGGQLLGPTYDYTHRLLDFSLAAHQDEAVDEPDAQPEPCSCATPAPAAAQPSIEALIRQLTPDAIALFSDCPPQPQVSDINHSPPRYPAARDQRLQQLARGDEGFLIGLAYAALRDAGDEHPHIAELRIGSVDVELEVPELDFPICIGSLELTECTLLTAEHEAVSGQPRLVLAKGFALGSNERKAIAMAVLDNSLTQRVGESGPYADDEFVLAHCDSVEANGYLGHLKLPHYVDFLATCTQLAGAAPLPETGGQHE